MEGADCPPGRRATSGATRAMMLRVHKGLASVSAEDVWHFLSACVVALAIVQVVILALSLVRVTVTRSLAVGVLGTACGVGCYEWRRQRRNSHPQTESLVVPVHSGRLLALWLGSQSVLSYLALWVAAYVLPDRSFDGNAYHIPTINLWALEGFVHWIPDSIPAARLMNGYPKGMESLSYVVVTAFGDSHLLNTANLLFLPLGVLGITFLSYTLGASPATALLAGAAYVLLPVSVCQASTVYVDSSHASCAIAFMAGVAHALTGIRRGRPLPWGDIPALGGAMGLTVATKASGPMLVALGTGALIAAAAIGARQAAEPKARRWVLRVALFAMAATAMGLLVGGYWYLRNYLITGSPLYPVGLTVGHRMVFPGASLATGIAMDTNTPEIMRPWPGIVRIGLAWLQGLSAWPRSIATVDSRLGGLGYLWILACVPSVLYLLCLTVRERAPTGWRAQFAVLFVVTTVAFVVTPMNWWARYTVWIYALGLPSFAAILERVWIPGRRQSLLGAWALVCLAVLSLEGALCLGAATGEIWPWRERLIPPRIAEKLHWQSAPYYVFPEMRGTVFDELLASDSAVALGPIARDSEGKRRIMGVLSLPIGRRLVFLPHNPDAQVMHSIAVDRVRYVVWDDSLALPDLLARAAIDMQHVGGFWVLRL